jgi:hypothetical protein
VYARGVTQVALVQGLIALAGATFFLPIIIFCAYPRSVRVWFEAGPEGIEKIASQEARNVIAILRELGFEPLGVKVEKPWLRAPIRELSFVARDRSCYAAIAALRVGARIYFFSLFPGGGLVLTANGMFPSISSPNVGQQSFRAMAPRELFERHHQAVASFGRRAEVGASQDERLAATRTYYATPEVQAVLRRTAFFLAFWFVALEWLLLRR